jgi:DNA gyrase subunit A
MGRATSGVTGMKFRDGDEMLSMSVIRAEQVAAEEAAEEASGQHGAQAELPGVQEQYVFTITDGGFAKRTRISEYRLQSRGGLGIKAMKADDERGRLVGAFIVVQGDEVLCIKESGQVTRSGIDELRPTGRDTKGVKFVGVSNGDSVVQVARSVERAAELEEPDEGEEGLSEASTDNASPEGSDAGDGAGATIEAEGAGAPAADAADVDGETEES